MQSPAAGTDFDIGEAISVGWSRFWPNFGPMALFAVIVWAINILFQFPPQDSGAAGTFLLSVVGFIFAQFVSIGWVAIALDIIDGRPVTANAVTSRFRLFLPYAIAAVLYGLMVGFGMIFLVVPGIILAIIFAFYGFHIVDTGEKDAIGALRRSAEITRGHRWKLFGLGVVLFALNVLGLIIFLIGVLFTSGISLLAIAHVYRRLSPAPVGQGYTA